MEDNGKKFRYDFFGEFLSQEVNRKADDRKLKTRVEQLQVTEASPDCNMEDSLMDFITEYFQGDVKEDFTTIEPEASFANDSSNEKSKAFDSSSSFTDNAFLESSSSNSEMNLTNEMLTSPESSLNIEGANREKEQNGSLEKYSDIISKNVGDSDRRKSVSYEIRFMNMKDSEEKVKIQIVPTIKPTENKRTLAVPLPPPSCSSPRQETNISSKLQYENTWLRKRLHDLERKLDCVETESERVVGELTRIIERKNEMISQLELQLAGVQFTSRK